MLSEAHLPQIRSVKQEGHTGLSNNPNVSSKTVPQECLNISVKQECLVVRAPGLSKWKANGKFLIVVRFFCLCFLHCYLSLLLDIWLTQIATDSRAVQQYTSRPFHEDTEVISSCFGIKQVTTSCFDVFRQNYQESLTDHYTSTWPGPSGDDPVQGRVHKSWPWRRWRPRTGTWHPGNVRGDGGRWRALAACEAAACALWGLPCCFF